MTDEIASARDAARLPSDVAQKLTHYYRLLCGAEPRGNRVLLMFRYNLIKLAYQGMPYPQNKGKWGLSIHDIADAVARETGPGSNLAKADVLKWLMMLYPKGMTAYRLISIIKTDPAGVTRAMRGTSLRDLGTLANAMRLIGEQAASPQAAANEFSDMLGPIVADVALTAFGDINTTRDLIKFQSISRELGIFMETIEFGVHQAAENVRKAIRDGAFIIKVFTKALNILIGKLPAVGKVIGYVDEAVKKEEGRELKAVDSLEAKLRESFGGFLESIFSAVARDTMDRNSQQQRVDIFLTHYENGYRMTKRSLEPEKTKESDE
eukprot:comp27777_c0_seq1/m.62856 comp27777_c0_seq1/g.62856  ORF comp27777_c0_seq1/g.62856 comp27777_c0_seq1/m.62856 type:complete len:322 (+) comp27777_c0_seq1:194-1159(+)